MSSVSSIHLAVRCEPTSPYVTSRHSRQFPEPSSSDRPPKRLRASLLQFKVGSDLNDVPSLVRATYYGALTSIAREDMATEGVDARKMVAAPQALAGSGSKKTR